MRLTRCQVVMEIIETFPQQSIVGIVLYHRSLDLATRM